MQERWKVIHTWGTRELFMAWLILTYFISKMTVGCLPLHFILLIVGFIFWVFIASCICEAIPFFKCESLIFLYTPEIPKDDEYYAIAIDKDGYILCRNTSRNTDLVGWWLVHHPIDKLSTKEIWENVII